MNLFIDRMKEINLHGITNLEPVRGGTDSWYWSTDYIHGDLYEAEVLFCDGHKIECNMLYLLQYPEGKIYEPIPKVTGQYIGYPIYDHGDIMLPVVHFVDEVIRILRFSPQRRKTEEIAQIPLSGVKDCYNLMLHTSPLMLGRQSNDNYFEIIWPERLCFSIEARETFNFRDGDKLYFTVWHEEPNYWDETIVRSLHDGSILDRYPGDIHIMPNGDKWLIR